MEIRRRQAPHDGNSTDLEIVIVTDPADGKQRFRLHAEESRASTGWEAVFSAIRAVIDEL